MAAPDPLAVARAHEEGLSAEERRAFGVWSTPPAVVAHVLDQVLTPALADASRSRPPTVLDPACGTGLFLVEAVRRLAAATGWSRRRVAERLIAGVDVDPRAVAGARLSLWTDTGEAGHPPPGWPSGVRVGDALGVDWPGTYDVVVGNPPFLSPLADATAPTPAEAAARRARFGPAVSAYTDAASVFLLLAIELADPDGGRVGLVLPQSVLSARDAAGVRAAALEHCVLETLWVAGERVFAASVMTCAPTFRRGATRGPTVLRRFRDGVPTPLDDLVVDPDDLARRPTWSHLAAAGFGVPTLPGVLGAGDVLRSEAVTTADFRDQYYGLTPHVVERPTLGRGAGRAVPLVTSGLIDPAHCSWGERPTRFRGRRWEQPAVDHDVLLADPQLGAWAAARLVPKVLVAAQTRVVEAVVDPTGAWLPSVPVLTVITSPERWWHVAAALSSPLASAWAAGTYLGAALSPGAIKLSARQLGDLPLPPAGHPAWDDAAEAVRAAHGARGAAARRAALITAAGHMARAYDLAGTAVADELQRWWEERLPGGAGLSSGG